MLALNARMSTGGKERVVKDPAPQDKCTNLTNKCAKVLTFFGSE